jgi:hypothetical protein
MTAVRLTDDSPVGFIQQVLDSGLHGNVVGDRALGIDLTGLQRTGRVTALTSPVKKAIQCEEICGVEVTARSEVGDDVTFRRSAMRRDRIWAGENEGRRKRRVTWGTVYRTIYDEAPALQ